MIIFALSLAKPILNKIDIFNIKIWVLPSIYIIIIIINFILYYFKILISSFILFHFFGLRKKRCFIRWLFWIFVDKTDIQIHKIKNLIAEYKKEFDNFHTMKNKIYYFNF